MVRHSHFRHPAGSLILLAAAPALAVGAWAAPVAAAASPPGTVTTIAGGIGAQGPARLIGLDPCNLAFRAGRLYVTDGGTIRQVVPRTDGLTSIAGVRTFGFAPDGTRALSAQLGDTCGLAVDSSGNVIFADQTNNRVRVIPASSGTFYGQAMAAGQIYTVAGTGVLGFTGDGGPALGAELARPYDVVLDHTGNIVIDDRESDRIRVIAASNGTFYGQAMTAGDIYTIAGDLKPGYSGDGVPATSAELDLPKGLAIDASGNIIIGDTVSNRVRVVAAATGRFYGVQMTAGDIYTVAGNGTSGFAGDGGSATSAALFEPCAVTVDGAGNLLIADTLHGRVRVVAATGGTFYGRRMTAGDIYTIAGDGQFGFNGDGGIATRASLADPSGVAVDSAGNLLIADYGSDRVRAVAVRSGMFYGLRMIAGHIYTVAGTGFPSTTVNGALATGTQLPGYMTVKLDKLGNLLITSEGNARVLYLPARAGVFWGQRMKSGHLYSIAGDGADGYSGDGGLAAKATIYPGEAITDSAGNLVIADTETSRVQVVAARTGWFWGLRMQAGHIYTVAGNGIQASSGLGGPAVRASIAGPAELALDGVGDLIISEIWGERVVVLARRSGTFYGQHLIANHLYSLAGDGSRGFSGDGGPATQATFDGPDALALDPADNIVVSDTSNARIRVIVVRTGTFYGRAMSAGRIYTIAGNGSFSGGGNGVLATATGIFPDGLAVDASGNIIFAESIYNRVRVVADATGSFYGQSLTAGDIYTIGGTGLGGFSGDGGPAIDAQFSRPDDVAVTASGDLLIADSGRIRLIS
jgi:trimeric autotransporter adhesin